MNSAKSWETLMGRRPRGAARIRPMARPRTPTPPRWWRRPDRATGAGPALDGELRLDAAIIGPWALEGARLPWPAGERAVFPDLDAGSIGYKLVHTSPRPRLRPVTQGIARR
ncbi:MAG: phosphate acyltransferase [Eggerthellaceae bacterium]